MSKELADWIPAYAGMTKEYRGVMQKYRTQKRGLMQKLLTGEWRLTPSFPRTRESRHPYPEPKPKDYYE